MFKLGARARDLVPVKLKWQRLPMCTRFLFILRESTALLFHSFLLHLRFKITSDREKWGKCVHSYISGTKGVNTIPFWASTRRQWARDPSNQRASSFTILKVKNKNKTNWTKQKQTVGSSEKANGEFKPSRFLTTYSNRKWGFFPLMRKLISFYDRKLAP